LDLIPDIILMNPIKDQTFPGGLNGYRGESIL